MDVIREVFTSWCPGPFVTDAAHLCYVCNGIPYTPLAFEVMLPAWDFLCIYYAKQLDSI